jgi:hypothetical protein
MWITVKRAAEIKNCSQCAIRRAYYTGKINRAQFNGKPHVRGSKAYVLMDEKFEAWKPGEYSNGVEKKVGHIGWDEVADIYNSGVPVIHIATSLNVSRTSVSNYLKKQGYRIVNGRHAQRQYANR